jgi:hypothetical protein
MKKRGKRIFKSKLKLKGKFEKNRKKKENKIKQQLLKEKEKEILSSMDLFANSTNLDLITSSKDLQKKIFEDEFVQNFIKKVEKSSFEEFAKKLNSKERAKEIKSHFSVSSITHKILEITQSFSSFTGKGRIITSGKACHGKNTLFIKEVRVGDTICVERSGTFKLEKRIINGVLSDTSVCLAIPFKPGISSFSTYSIEPKSK